MPRTTDLPERILGLIEKSNKPVTVSAIAAAVDANTRTVGTHLRDLYARGLITREWTYNLDTSQPFPAKVGHYVYARRTVERRAAR